MYEGVSFDRLQDKQTFLHRSGRAGRFGGEGFCVCISSEDERPSFEYLACSFRISLHYSLADLIQIQQRQMQKQIQGEDKQEKLKQTEKEEELIEGKEKEEAEGKEEHVKGEGGEGEEGREEDEGKDEKCSLETEVNDERRDDVLLSLRKEDFVTRGEIPSMFSPSGDSSSSSSLEKLASAEASSCSSSSCSLIEDRCSSIQERTPSLSVAIPVGLKAHECYREKIRGKKIEKVEGGERHGDTAAGDDRDRARSLRHEREDLQELPYGEGGSAEEKENVLLSFSSQGPYKEKEIKKTLEGEGGGNVSMEDVLVHSERYQKVGREAETEEKDSPEKEQRGGGVLDGRSTLGGVLEEDNKEDRKNTEEETKKKKKGRQETETKVDIRLEERKEDVHQKEKEKDRQTLREETSSTSPPFIYEDVSVLKIPLIGMFISHADLLHSLSSSSSSSFSFRSSRLRSAYQGSSEFIEGKESQGNISLQELPSFSPSRDSSSPPPLACDKGERKKKKTDDEGEEEEHPYAFFSSPLSSLGFSLLQTIKRDRRRSKERMDMKGKTCCGDTNDNKRRGGRVLSYEEEGGAERDRIGDRDVFPLSLPSSSAESNSVLMENEEISFFSIKLETKERLRVCWLPPPSSSFSGTSLSGISPEFYPLTEEVFSPWISSNSSSLDTSSFFPRAEACHHFFSSPREDDAPSSFLTSSSSSFAITLRPEEFLPVSEGLQRRRIQDRSEREKRELEEEEERWSSSLSFLLLSFVSCEEETRRSDDHEKDSQAIVGRGGVYTHMRILRSSSLKGLIQRKAIVETGRSSLCRSQQLQRGRRDAEDEKGVLTKVKGNSEEEEAERRIQKYMIFAYSRAYEDIMREALEHIDSISSRQQKDHRRLLAGESGREEDKLRKKKKMMTVNGVEKNDLLKQNNDCRGESTGSFPLRLSGEGEPTGECLGGREEKTGEGERTRRRRDSGEKNRDADSPSRGGDSSREKAGRRHSSREVKDERKNKIKRGEVGRSRKEGRAKRGKRDDVLASDDRHALWCIFEAACAAKGREEGEEERQRQSKADLNSFRADGREIQQREKDQERERSYRRHRKENDSGWSDSCPTDKTGNEGERKKRREKNSESEDGKEREQAANSSWGPSPSSVSKAESIRRRETKEFPSSGSSSTMKESRSEAHRALIQLKSMHAQFWKNRLLHRHAAKQ